MGFSFSPSENLSNSNMPKVSVIVPVYGVESYIAKCAVSLFEQTLEDIEYIFINDCSPDNSISVLKKVIKTYEKQLAVEQKVVRIVNMPTNSGLPAVRRHGIQLATGDYIIHCDSDDTIDPEMLEVMYNTAVNGNYDLVTCEIDWSNGYQMPFVECKDNIELIKATLTGRVIESVCTKLTKRTLYNNANFIYPKDNVNEDCVLSVQIAYYCNSFKQLPNKFYHYYMRQGSISHTKDAEKMLRNLYQFKANVGLIEQFLTDIDYIDKVKLELDTKKITCKNHIIPLTSINKYRKIWLHTYPDIRSSVLFNPYFSTRTKIIYYCSMLKLYSLLQPIFTKNKK